MGKKLLLGLGMAIFMGGVFCLFGCGRDGNSSNLLFDRAGKLFESGDYDGAIKNYLGGLRIEPNNAVGYNFLGMAYRFKFNQSGAQEFKEMEIDAFMAAVSIDPKFWVAYKNLSVSLYYQGMKKEAVPYLERSLELQPNDPEKELLLRWIEEGKK